MNYVEIPIDRKICTCYINFVLMEYLWGIFIITQTPDLTIFHYTFLVCIVLYPLIIMTVWPSDFLLYSQPLFPDRLIGKCPVSYGSFYHISILPKDAFRRRLFCNIFHKYRLHKPQVLSTMNVEKIIWSEQLFISLM